MSSRHHLASSAALFALAAAPLAAQDAALAFARACVAATAPAADDPDADVRQILAALARCPKAPYAHLLLTGTIGDLGEVQDPAALLAPVEQLFAIGGQRGDLRLELARLRFRLLLAAGRGADAAAVDPMAGAPDSVLCVGPFGDDGDDFAGVPFPPELVPWRQGVTFEGRGHRLTPRAERRGIGVRTFDPGDRARPQPGCYYTLHRVAAAAEVQCYLLVAGPGALQVFVDGRCLGTFDPALDDGRRAHLVPVGFAAGEHQVLVKSCSKDRVAFELDYRDGGGDRVAGLREVPAATPFAPPPAPIAASLPAVGDLYAALAAAARTAVGADRDTLLVAAGLVADSLGQVDLPLEVVEQVEAPAEPTTALALARLWRRIAVVPEEQRNSKARALEEPAIRALPATHFAALRANVELLEEKDQREDALRLLWRAIDAGRAGPGTFRQLRGVAERARFAAEEARVLQRWAAALPRDPEPRAQLARRCQEAGATAAAKAHAAAAVRLRPDLRDNLARVFYLALDTGDPTLARELCDLAMPAALLSPTGQLARDLWEATTRFQCAEPADWLAFSERMLAHPDVDARRLHQYADLMATRGFDDAAAAAYRRCLELAPDDEKAERTLARLLHAPPPDDAFARFRRDGDAAIAAFHATEREAAAPATLLIDQMLVEVMRDGSQRVEVHQLRRLNDPTGVEDHKEADEPARADELVLLRTVDAAGQSYVPVRIKDSYAMPHLEPGAFVEWIYRDRHAAPGDGVCRVPQFTFQSLAENTVLAELVVISATDTDLTLRTRNFQPAVETVDLGDGRTARRYLVENTPRVLPERFMPPAAELVPVVAGGADGSLAAALRRGAHRLAQSSRPTPPIRARAAALTEGIADPLARLRALDAFCQGEITSARAGSATETLLRQKGNRQLLLTALLRAAGFTLEPARCESIRADLVDAGGELFADPAALYDEDCVRVTADGMPPQWLFYNPPRWFPPELMAPQRSGAGVAVATPAGLEIGKLPAATMHSQDMVVTGEGKLVDDRIEIEVTVTLRGEDGYSAAEHFERQPTNVQRQFARQFLPSLFAGWQIRDAALLPFAAGKPLAVHGTLKKRALQPEGNHLLLPIPLQPGQFLAGFGDRPGRTTPLRLTMDLSLAWDLRLDLGEHALTALPPPLVLQHGPLQYLQELHCDGNALVLRRRARMGAGTIPVAQLGDWLAALQQVERAENQNLELVAR